jgi:5'-nucleotidase
MRILVTNDDGIHAMGLAVLETIARAIGDEVWVVAPEVEQSGASRALTLTAPIRVRDIGPKRFAVSGTPTDCVLLAVETLLGGLRPDLVLSGINRGQNVAEDVTLSGTIAGAVQGMQLGIPSIALSQSLGFREEKPIPWECAAEHGENIIRRLLQAGWPADSILNVNFPDCAPADVAGVEVTRQGHRDQHVIFADERTDPRGRAYFWLGFRGERSNPPEGTDLHAIYSRKISISPLHYDLTQYRALETLSAALA